MIFQLIFHLVDGELQLIFSSSRRETPVNISSSRRETSANISSSQPNSFPQRMDPIEQNCNNDSQNHISENPPLSNPHTPRGTSEISSSFEVLDDKVNLAMEDISQIKQDIYRNKKDIRDIFLAMMEEFQLIRTNVSGMQELPPLNLSNCSPLLINESDYQLRRGLSSDATSIDGESTANASQIFEGSKLNSGRSSNMTQSTIIYRTTRNLSGLLHLVSRNTPVYEEGQTSPITEQNQLPNEPRFINSYLSNRNGNLVKNISWSKLENDIFPHFQVESQEILKNLKETVEQFIREKESLIQNLDKKVDQDVVERMFNKI